MIYFSWNGNALMIGLNGKKFFKCNKDGVIFRDPSGKTYVLHNEKGDDGTSAKLGWEDDGGKFYPDPRGGSKPKQENPKKGETLPSHKWIPNSNHDYWTDGKNLPRIVAQEQRKEIISKEEVQALTKEAFEREKADLTACFQNPSTKFIVGAGVTIASVNRDPKTLSWDGVLDNALSEYFRPDKLASIDVWTKSDIAHRLLQSNPDYFRDWLQKTFTFQEGDLKPNNVAEIICQFKGDILTTNYDNILELANKKVSASSNDKLIEHIHGFHENHDSIVLSRESYQKVMNENLSTMHAWTIHGAIFIGIGLTVDDPHFKYYRERLRVSWKYPSFFITKDDCYADFAASLKPIRVVSCGDSWDKLPGFLHQFLN